MVAILLRSAAAMLLGLVLPLAVAAPTSFPLPAEPEAGSPQDARRETDRAKKMSQPLWELGIGLGGLTLPDYRGSDERSAYLLPVPFFVYRGHFLRADREGARAVLLDGRRFEVNVSVNGSPPVRNQVDGARAGMPKLPGSFEIGPNVKVALWHAEDRRSKLDLRLPLRTAITLQRSPHAIGSVFAPNLNYDRANVFGGWSLGLQSGPTFATRHYHQHYYGVAPQFARPERPAYRVRGGYAGWQVVGATSRRIDNVWYGAFMRYDNLSGAVFDESPLVKRRSAVTAGFGVSWVLSRSEHMVDVSPER